MYTLKEHNKGLVYKKNFFTALGFNYLGPVDGHNVKALEQLFEIAKTYSRPSLIHVIPTKGKGYSYAESSTKSYHGVSPFDVEKGATESGKLTFSDVAGAALCSLAENDPKICAITAAMTSGTGLTAFAGKYKSRFFDVGIAEQHAVSFAAGLASEGMKPFFVVYSSFLQRGFDQVIHDIAIGGFPVRLLIDRAGIVGEDGETHQGLFDVPFLTSVPNLTVYSPCYYRELERDIIRAAETDAFCAVLYPRGCEKEEPDCDFSEDYTLIKGESEKLIITYGRLFSDALEAKKKRPELNILKLNKIYPLSDDCFNEIKAFKEVHFFEESIKNGGIGELCAARLLEDGFSGKYKIHAIDGKFVPCAAVSSAIKLNGLDSESMLKATEG